MNIKNIVVMCCTIAGITAITLSTIIQQKKMVDAFVNSPTEEES